MSELTLTLIKVGFLALLWLFVLSSVSVIRSDMFGERVDPRRTAAKTAKTKPSRRPPKKKRGAPTKLVISEGANAGVTVPLEGAPILLGRGADAAIRLDDDYVSTRHARFVTNGEEWFIEDMGSTNGTYLNGRQLRSVERLQMADTIRIGDSEYRYEE